jgi:hypothetical protein
MDIENYNTHQMLIVDGYVKVRDAFYTRVLIWVTTLNILYFSVRWHFYAIVVTFVKAFLYEIKFTKSVIPTYFCFIHFGHILHRWSSHFCNEMLSWVVESWMKNHFVSDTKGRITLRWRRPPVGQECLAKTWLYMRQMMDVPEKN